MRHRPRDQRSTVRFREDVIKGLRSQVKTIPCKYFYDERGAALFEAICKTPEYYPTRTEIALPRQGPRCHQRFMTAARTQLERIIEILERDGQIDNFYPIHNRVSLRLGARIWDLRQQGWEFATEQRGDKNTVYRVVRQPAPKQLSLV